MNTQLKDAMDEQAWRASQAPVDLGPVIASGDRRRRVRGLASVGAAGVVVAAVTFGAVQVIGGTGGTGSLPFASSGELTERAATYASGSTIHHADTEIDVDSRIRSFVRTDDGYVYVAAEQKVWFTDGESQRRIGRLAATDDRIVTDESGSYVAWVEDSEGGPPEFVVYDTSTSTEALRTSEGTRDGANARVGGRPAVIAIDGDVVYVRDARGFARIDIQSGQSELLRPGVDKESEVVDVESGVRLRRINVGNPDEGESDPLDFVLRRDGVGDGRFVVTGGRDLSPTGRYVTADVEDSERIFDTRTGDEVVLDTSAYGFQGMMRWLDSDTVTVGVLKDPADAKPEISLLRCEVPSGECAVAADNLPENLVVPVGGDRPFN